VGGEAEHAGLGGESGGDDLDVGDVVAVEVFGEEVGDGGVGLECDDARAGVIVFEAEDGEAHVAAAVDDERVGAVGGEAVDAADEDVLVLHVGVGAVGDAEAVVADLAD
jgi:hypothetical protein